MNEIPSNEQRIVNLHEELPFEFFLLKRTTAEINSHSHNRWIFDKYKNYYEAISLAIRKGFTKGEKGPVYDTLPSELEVSKL